MPAWRGNPDEHAFGPSFFAAMARTTGFFESEL
jgi:hypothetical protein